LAVSNGSFQNQCGVCAWIIEGTNKTNRIEGSMVALGNMGDHSAFQSKATGLYGLLLTMWYLLKEESTQGVLTVACNGRSVLDRLQSKKPIDPFAVHANLLITCKQIQGQLPCEI